MGKREEGEPLKVFSEVVRGQVRLSEVAGREGVVEGETTSGCMPEDLVEQEGVGSRGWDNLE